MTCSLDLRSVRGHAVPAAHPGVLIALYVAGFYAFGEPAVFGVGLSVAVLGTALLSLLGRRSRPD